MRSHCVDCGLPSFEMDLRTGTNRCLPCRKKNLGREPREFTKEEVAERFLQWLPVKPKCEHRWVPMDGARDRSHCGICGIEYVSKRV